MRLTRQRNKVYDFNKMAYTEPVKISKKSTNEMEKTVILQVNIKKITYLTPYRANGGPLTEVRSTVRFETTAAPCN